MENEKTSNSEKSSCHTSHCHSAKFILGVLVGIAASFIVGFAFITMFAGNLLDSGYTKDTDTIPSADTTEKAGLPPAPPANANNLIASAAKKSGLDEKAIATCISEGKFSKDVQSDVESGIDAGIKSTPTSIVVSKYGMTLVPGAQPIDTFKEIIDGHISGQIENTQDLDIPAITKDDNIRGNANAAISIVEYSDIDCPFCKRHHPTLISLVEDYDGQVNWVYRHFPLDQLHPDARKKAEATECAGDLGGSEKFWEVLDTLNES
jgi:protein-disulfide isomerase